MQSETQECALESLRHEVGSLADELSPQTRDFGVSWRFSDVGDCWGAKCAQWQVAEMYKHNRELFVQAAELSLGIAGFVPSLYLPWRSVDDFPN